MKRVLMAGIAALSFSAALTGIAVAQETSPPGTEASPLPDNVPPPPSSDPAATMPGEPAAPGTPAPPPPADPNAGVPTGAVPADTGMMPAPPNAPSDPAAPVGSSSNPVTVGGNVTPPPPTPKDYPVCSKTVQDSCINPGEVKRKSRR